MGIERFSHRDRRHWWGLAYTVLLGALALSAALTGSNWATDAPRSYGMEQSFDVVFGLGMGVRFAVYHLAQLLRWNQDDRGVGAQLWAPLSGRWLRLFVCVGAFVPIVIVSATAVGLACGILANLIVRIALSFTH